MTMVKLAGAAVVVLTVAAAEPAAKNWVDMSTGPSTRLFVNTASVKVAGRTAAADVVIIGPDSRRSAKLELNCINRQYRIDGGSWRDDDPANVKRVCGRDFAGLKRHSKGEVDAVSVVKIPARALRTTPGKWILVDWTIDQMMLVDPASITRNPSGWRFNAIVQFAGRERVQTEFLADCVNKRAVDLKQQKADFEAMKKDLFFTLLRVTGQRMNRSMLDIVTYVAFCMEWPPQLHDAPGVEPAAALSARDQFETDRSRYLRANPEADVSKAINIAPGPNELGGYQLSFMDIIMPSGLRSEIVGKEENRTVVQQAWKHPFSAVGRLLIKEAKGWSQCTASLIGNNQTILTAKHCAPGTQFLFAPGNSGLKTAIPAAIVASGDRQILAGRTGPDIGNVMRPNADWDDWMVLSLERPSPGEPLAIPSRVFIEDTIKRFEKPYFHIAGFPADVKDGEQMIYSRGCGTEVSYLDYKGTRISETSCAAYGGSSGSAMLVLTPQHRYVPVGVLSGGYRDDTRFSILMIGGRAFDVVRAKVAAECRAKPPGVRFHPQACNVN